MAGGERTEQATPRRRQDARKKGQVAKSLEINSAIGLLVGFMSIRLFGDAFFDQWHQIAAEQFRRLGTFALTEDAMRSLGVQLILSYGKLVLPVLGILAITGLVANLVQGGFVFSTTPLMPDFARLNPLQGIARLFSARTMAEMAKSTLKAFLVGYQIYAFFRDNQDRIITLVGINAREIGPELLQLCWSLLVKVLVVIIVIAVADYAFQRWQFEKSLRMTKEDIKEEMKSTEGNPLTKQRARQRQRDLSRNRMMSDVKTATVVITNPTHYAIALLYTPGEMLAPKVVAKGQRLIAQKIKELAKEHGVPVMENKPLARALYKQCEVGSEIPMDLYQAVAEIIAFVFKQSGRAPR